MEGVGRWGGIHFALQWQRLVLKGAQELLMVDGTDGRVYGSEINN